MPSCGDRCLTDEEKEKKDKYEEYDVNDALRVLKRYQELKKKPINE